MNSTLSRSTAYSFSETLQPEALPDSIYSTQPGESDREELLLQKLGPTGWGRIHHFRHFYQPGWGEGLGRTLSPRALNAFYEFVEKATFDAVKKPSVFLTDDGGLEMVWEDANNQSIQLEFSAEGVELFRQSTQQERFFPATEISTITQLIR